ncbi:MAG TPA: O-antigen ligase family protein [Stenomitos sp.]
MVLFKDERNVCASKKVSKVIKPENIEEKIVWFSIVGTYIYYPLGALYFIGPICGYVLLFILVIRWFKQVQQSKIPNSEKIQIPVVTWIWVVGMLIELLALVMGHMDWELGLSQLVKSTFGWAKGWALLAIFPLAGSLKIRPCLIYRAVSILCVQTLIIAPFLVAFSFLKININYVSILNKLGGAGDIFFQVQLYDLHEQEGEIRFPFFTPWSPALGLLGNIYFPLVFKERNLRLRAIGIITCILICYLSKSRMALMCLPLVVLSLLGIQKILNPIFLVISGIGALVLGVVGTFVEKNVSMAWEEIRSSRAASTRVRDALQNIALERFRDAPIWGHGIVETGPKIVEHMPIGSHHTIISLLYIKGIVGLLGFLLPLIISFEYLLVNLRFNPLSQLGITILLILTFYSFGENLEVLAYLFWPGLILLGMAFKRQTSITNSWI